MIKCELWIRNPVPNIAMEWPVQEFELPSVPRAGDTVFVHSPQFGERMALVMRVIWVPTSAGSLAAPLVRLEAV